MSLGSSFNTSSMGVEPSAAVKPQITVLQSIAPKTNFSVQTTALNSHRVSANGANAESLVQPNRQAVASVQNDVQSQMGAVQGVVRQAQSEVLAAMQAENLSATGVFPNQQMAGNDTTAAFGMLFDPGSELRGAGTLATALQDRSSPDLSFGSEDNMSREEAMNRIEDQLRSMSTQQNGWDGGMPGANQASTLQAGIDWNEFFDAGHELDDIMYLNTENMANFLPEYGQLAAQLHQADEILAELDGVETKIDAGHVKLVGDSVKGFQDGPLSMAGGMKRSVDKPETSEDLEFDPREVTVQPTGMTATV